MSTRHILATSIAALALVAAPSLHAAPASVNLPVHAAFGKVKTIALSIRNDSGTLLELKVGEDLMKLDPGKTLQLHLPVGTRVFVNNTTPNLTAGSLVAEVGDYMSGATLSIK